MFLASLSIPFAYFPVVMGKEPEIANSFAFRVFGKRSLLESEESRESGMSIPRCS